MISDRSRQRLVGVHPDLTRVVLRAANNADFAVIEGLRTLERQKYLVAKGASKTMRSRHLKSPNGYAHAVDLACTLKGTVRWDWPMYDNLAKRMKAAAKKEKVPLEWGGDWVSFKDGPHFQLPWAQYPGTKTGVK